MTSCFVKIAPIHSAETEIWRWFSSAVVAGIPGAYRTLQVVVMLRIACPLRPIIAPMKSLGTKILDSSN